MISWVGIIAGAAWPMVVGPMGCVFTLQLKLYHLELKEMRPAHVCVYEMYSKSLIRTCCFQVWLHSCLSEKLEAALMILMLSPFCRTKIHWSSRTDPASPQAGFCKQRGKVRDSTVPGCRAGCSSP
jgi:hypothetical protein